MIAATVFFNSDSSAVVSAGLFDAYDLIKERIGQGQPYLDDAIRYFLLILLPPYSGCFDIRDSIVVLWTNCEHYRDPRRPDCVRRLH